MHYLIWKLSYLWGRAYSDISLSYEQLLTAPRKTVRTLFERVGLADQLTPQLTSLIRCRAIGKWRSYADDSWFAAQERHAEQLLSTFLGRCSTPPATTRHRSAA